MSGSARSEKTPKKIVVIGGAKGISNVIVGLRAYLEADITAVISTADNGGSSGLLSECYGVGPVGDLRRVCGALADDNETSELLSLAEYRYTSGCLAPHTFGNLVLLTLFQRYRCIEQAIEKYCKMIGAKGSVIPVTLGKQTLWARREDGSIVEGESRIDVSSDQSTSRITKVWLSPKGIVNPKAETAIRDADVVIIGPGDHFTSIIPNLLVPGIPSAIKETKAMVVYVPNLMTKPSETPNYQMRDLVADINSSLGTTDAIDLIIANNEEFPPDVLESYAMEAKHPIFPTEEGVRGVRIPIRTAPLLNHHEHWHHDPYKIGKVISDCCLPAFH